MLIHIKTSFLDTSTRLTLLRTLESHPDLSQRALAKELGISLGKTNYCLRALIDKGYVKAVNFGKSNAKHRYIYQLTPQGIAAKARITRRFLMRKLQEHDALIKEIEDLRAEIEQTPIVQKSNGKASHPGSGPLESES